MKLLALLVGSAVMVTPVRLATSGIVVWSRAPVMSGRKAVAVVKESVNGQLSFTHTKQCSDLCAIIILYKIVILTVSKLTRGFPYY